MRLSDIEANAVWLRNLCMRKPLLGALCADPQLQQQLSSAEKITEIRTRGGFEDTQYERVMLEVEKFFSGIEPADSSSSSLPHALPLQIDPAKKQYIISKVAEVLAEWQHKLSQSSKYGPTSLAFSPALLAQYIVDRELINAAGPCQGNKSRMIATACVTSALADTPCLVGVCDTVNNTKGVVEKLNEYFQEINPILAGAASSSSSSSSSSHSPPELKAVYVGSAAALKRELEEGEPFERVQSGQTVLVFAHTKSQIAHIRERVLERMYKRPLLILDEADKFWNSVPDLDGEEDEDDSGSDDNAKKPRPIAREREFYKLARCLLAPDDSDVSAATAAAAAPAAAAAAAAAAGVSSRNSQLTDAPTEPAALPTVPATPLVKTEPNTNTDNPAAAAAAEGNEAGLQHLAEHEQALFQLARLLAGFDESPPAAAGAGPSASPNMQPNNNPAAAAAAAAAAGEGTDTLTGSDPAAAAPAPAAPAHHRRFPALFTLMAVSATPIDMLTYCVKAQLPVRVVMLDREVMSGNGYVGPADLKPFEDGAGNELFLNKGDVTASTDYRFKPSLDSDRALVVDCYKTIAAAAAAGKRGVMTIDITTPRVTVENNTLQRAKQLVRLHPSFLTFVICGDGVYMVHAGAEGSRVAAAAAAVAAGIAPVQAAAEDAASNLLPDCFDLGSSSNVRCTTQLVAGFTAATKKQLREKRHLSTEANVEQEVLQTLKEVLSLLDPRMATDGAIIREGFLDVPVVLIGYAMIRRSLSVRSDLRVPTHIICAPSSGISLADLVQMMGRGMGNKRVLEGNGRDYVRVLAYKEDVEAVQLYYEFVEYLYEHRADGTLPSLIQTMENVPAKYRSVLDHSRRQGQRGMQSGKVLRRLTKFEETAEQREMRLRAGTDGELSPALHELLLALWHLTQKLRKAQVSTQDIRDHFVPELRHANIEGGHFSGVRYLKQGGYIVALSRQLWSQGVYLEYELTGAGMKYAQKYVESIPVAKLLR